ncbi:trypsin-like peptidase domain-containing protein [Flavihumibacter sp. R14]|nr:trypsin-like peptidase domain-containing protein [Flavihumibacter soli]
MIRKILCIGILIILCTQSGYPQNPCAICEKLKNNVVKIHATFDDGSDENGFGFVIAEQYERLFIVTAKHVIHQLDDDGLVDLEKKTRSVSITFNSEIGKEYPATLLLNLPNTSLDVTILEVEKPANYLWQKDFYSTNLAIGTEVWFIGRAGNWYIPTGSAIGSINDISSDGVMLVDITSIEPGTSGAPLLNKMGIVGLIFEDASSGAKAYPIETVQRLVTKSWNKPWQMNLQTNEVKVGSLPEGSSSTVVDKAWIAIANENKENRKISLLETYVSKGQGNHVEEARKMYEGLLWANIDRARYMEKYVQHFPDGQYIEQVEDKVFRSSKFNPEFYSRLFPNGKYIEQINKQIEADQKEEATKLNNQQEEEENRLITLIRSDFDRDAPSYLNVGEYLEKFPQGKFVHQVEELVWERALSTEKLKMDPTGKYVWEPATPTVAGHWRRKRVGEGSKKEAFEYYLKYFPNGMHANAARKKVSSY